MLKFYLSLFYYSGVYALLVHIYPTLTHSKSFPHMVILCTNRSDVLTLVLMVWNWCSKRPQNVMRNVSYLDKRWRSLTSVCLPWLADVVNFKIFVFLKYCVQLKIALCRLLRLESAILLFPVILVDEWELLWDYTFVCLNKF